MYTEKETPREAVSLFQIVCNTRSKPIMTYNEDASYGDLPSCAFCAYAY